MSSQVVPEHAEIPPPTIEEVSDGIFAYIQLDGTWFLHNAGMPGRLKSPRSPRNSTPSNPVDEACSAIVAKSHPGQTSELKPNFICSLLPR